MTVIQAIILGIIQGITEYLPISSSGHLILIPYLFGWDLQDLNFDVSLHLGTAFASLIFFWRDWHLMAIDSFNDLKTPSEFRNRHKLRRGTKILTTIIIVSIPVAVAGLLFEDIIENIFRSAIWVSIMMFLITGFMYFADRYSKSLDKSFLKTEISSPTFIDSLLISVSQIIALIPGSSRSGCSISTGLYRNLSRENAARYSFLLGTPIILGAGLYQSKELVNLPQSDIILYLIGFFTSFITGLIVIKWLLAYLRNKDLKIFIIYRLILAGVIIFVYFYQ